MPDTDLGPFRLASPFARGAMGEVWRAWHRDQRLPVALKVLTATNARNPRYVRGFQNEARAVASLDHPHIVTLLDVGVVDARAAAASGGRLVEGSPWLAMEYASHGTLADTVPSTWSDVRRLLLTMLDALAHAHARGIIHRDLKPANLLFCGERDPRPGLKLTDFGIAARFGEEDLAEPGAGTPAFMAPEQLMGEQADLGPWTDLYSLGCLAWRLVTGKLPFDGLKRIALVRAHLSREPPPLAPAMDVPPGVEAWLRALLAKRPEERPQRAADAAAALAALGEEGGATRHGADVVAMPSVDTETLTAPGTLLSDELDTTEIPFVPRVERTIGPPGRVPDWRESVPRRPPVLVGASLGLFGLREPPLVGRAEEQDALWDELRAVHAEGRPRVVRLSGPAGVGKTRLASWLCRRADELGAARVLWVAHAPRDELSGLNHLISRLLRCEGLEREERERHLLKVIGDEDVAAMVSALLAGELPASARREVASRVVGQAASERPIVLCLDDAQWAGDALALVPALLERECAILILVVIQDEGVGGRPEATRLDTLPGLTLALGPLDGAARRELVRALLGLEQDLATQVEARSGGNPLFAMQLIGDWVARGLLQVGERGFVLDPSARAPGGLSIPDDLHQVWVQRVQRVLEGLHPAAGWDLEVAAALGPEVDEWAWHAACDDPEGERLGWERGGRKRRARIVDRLLRARLATERDEGWSFAHGMLRESVIRLSRERGRWQSINRVCANALRLRRDKKGAQERIGRLLVEAGMPQLALRPLLDGVDELEPTSVRDALAVLAEAEAAAREARLPEADPLSGRLVVTRARIHAALDEFPAALEWAHRALEAARRHHPDPADRDAIRDGEPWTRHYREALRVELTVHLTRRDPKSARRVFEQLAPLVRALGDPGLLGELLTAQAGLFQSDPRHADEADAILVEAASWFERNGNPERVGRVLVHRALIAKEAGRLDRARELLEEALDRIGARGARYPVGIALATLAEVHLRLGEVHRAEQVARRALVVLETLGTGAAEPRVAIGLALSSLGEHEAALAELTRAHRICLDHGRRDLLAVSALGVALVEARLQRWSAVHDRLRDAERVSEDVLPDAHARLVAHELALAARAGGFPQLAARAASLAATSPR